MRSVFRLPDSPRRAGGEVRAELDHHIELRAREFEEQGISPERARERALEAFGDREAIEAECRRLRAGNLRVNQRRERMQEFVRDLGYAWRGLVRDPGFTAVAVVTLALGIGANSAVFTVINAALLTPLPYADASELVQVSSDMRRLGIDQPEYLSPPDFEDLRDQNTTLSGLAAYSNWGANLTGEGEPVRLAGMAVNHNMFGVLGVAPQHGRTFNQADDLPGAARVVLLSYGLWQRQFGGDSTVVGNAITLNGDPWEVVGVLPAAFRFPVPGVEVWRPFQQAPPGGCGRGCVVLRAVGRMKPGIEVAQVESDLDLIYQRLADSYPETNVDLGAWIIPLQQAVMGPIRAPLLALGGAVVLVLLLACVNLASLLVARGTSRAGEVAVRVALGAGKARLVRQFLTESLLLAGLGASAGLALGLWGTDLLGAALPPAIQEIADLGLSWEIIAFTAAVSLVSGIGFGLYPARAMSAAGPASVLRLGRDSGGRASFIRSGLVVAEVGLAVVLLAGAGLMMRSFLRTQAVDLGFDHRGIVAATLMIPSASGVPTSEVVDRSIAWKEDLERLPTVRDVALTTIPPFSNGDNDASFVFRDEPAPPSGREPTGWYRQISDGYFRAMGIPLVGGREFTPADRADAPRVVIVNETLVKRFWSSDSSPIGRIIELGRAGGRPVTVVGIAADIKHNGPTAAARAEFYLPLRQQPVRQINVMVRGEDGREDGVVRDLRATFRQAFPGLPLASVTTMEERLGAVLALPRLFLALFAVFAVVALLLAAVGIYGVLAFSISRRTRELGVRIALGAERGQVIRLVLRDALRLIGLGLALGLGLTLLFGGALESLLFETPSHDVLTLVVVTALLGGVGVMATVGPARRAAALDPVEAMRTE